MYKNPVVSIVLPFYENKAFLREALDSIRLQTFKNFEVLLCNDGSKEDISALISEYGKDLRIQHLILNHFGGPASPRNAGIRASKADWIALLDSDDLWSPSKLEIIMRENINKYDVIYHKLLAFPKRFATRPRYIGTRDSKRSWFEDLLLNSPIPTSSALVRRNVALQAGLFSEDPRLISVEDYDFWLKLAKIDARFCFVDEVLGYYRVHSGSISKPSLRTVCNWEVLSELHFIGIREKLRKEVISKVSYLVGSVAFSCRKYDVAHSYLRKSKPMGIGLKLKRLIKLIVCKIKLLQHHD